MHRTKSASLRFNVVVLRPINARLPEHVNSLVVLARAIPCARQLRRTAKAQCQSSAAPLDHAVIRARTATVVVAVSDANC